MIGDVNNALMEIQGALVARSLYPMGHPRIHACEERAGEILRGALETVPEITLFSLEDRVIYDGEILPSSSSLTDTLFPMLQQRGVDQLTFRRGLEPSDITRLLDALASNDTVTCPLKSTAHVGLGFLRHAGADNTDAKKRRPVTLAYAEDAADVLADVWKGVGEDDRLNTGILGEIVSCISKVIDDNPGAMLPLAPLKRHDEYTFVHTVNVAILSVALGEALGFDSHTCHELSIAALLHDVGKQAIPREILDKQGRFTEEEFRTMQLHTTEGARLLLNTPGVPELAPIVAYEHHVRINGTGYPRMPKGWKLNLASRIVQVADVFDALRTTRPYRAGLPVPRVVEVMRHDVGVFFDEDLLTIFFEQVVARGLPA